MIATLVLGATATPDIVQKAEPWAAQDSALIGRLLASPPAACSSDGLMVSGGRVTGAKIYDQMTGFAQSAGTKGGLSRRLFMVDRADDSPGQERAGSLRWAVVQAALAGGGWIAFASKLDGVTIRLNSPLRLASNITIDGGCAMPRLVGAGRGSILYLRGSRNVVITRLRFEHAGAGQDGDCITVSHGADRVWLAFLRLRHCRDGLIDVTRDGATGPMRVTVSNNRFSDHDKAMLVVGSLLAAPCSALKSPIQLTLAHNIFYHTGQRHPRVSGDAFVHLHDNVIAFNPRPRGNGNRGGAYGTLAVEGAHVVVARTLYIPPAEGKKLRLIATHSPSARRGCQQGHIELKRDDLSNGTAARRAFIRAVIRATEHPGG